VFIKLKYERENNGNWWKNMYVKIEIHNIRWRRAMDMDYFIGEVGCELWK